MLSTVDTEPRSASLVKRMSVSGGVAVSRLNSGNFALGTHLRNTHGVLDLTACNLLFATDIAAFPSYYNNP